MDYTDLAKVKEALGANEDTDDTLLERLMTAASRSIDRYCAGTQADDYFAGAAVANERRRGVIDGAGLLYVFPLKPVITSVVALSYRASPAGDWTSVDVSKAAIDGYEVCVALGGSVVATGQRGKVWIQISYTGGCGASVDDLPADVVEAATVLAVRLYKEVKSGLGDSIGVAELGTLMYTKAWPTRVLEMLKPWRRVVW